MQDNKKRREGSITHEECSIQTTHAPKRETAKSNGQVIELDMNTQRTTMKRFTRTGVVVSRKTTTNRDNQVIQALVVHLEDPSVPATINASRVSLDTCVVGRPHSLLLVGLWLVCIHSSGDERVGDNVNQPRSPIVVYVSRKKILMFAFHVHDLPHARSLVPIVSFRTRPEWNGDQLSVVSSPVSQANHIDLSFVQCLRNASLHPSHNRFRLSWTHSNNA